MRIRLLVRKDQQGSVRLRVQQGDKHWTTTIDDMVEQHVLEEAWEPAES
jgi:hypothetical protein